MRYAVGDTIAAIATAPGAAGVGVLRVSGPEALALADAMFRGRRRPSRTPGGRFLFGRLLGDGDEVLDEGLCLVFRAPHSYTGEDVAELQAHGSPAVLQALLRRALALGARAARPGEFTERAYRSGRLNLAQAEAVDLLVRAHSEAERRQGAAGLSGELSARTARVAAGLTRALAAIAALLDYPDEGVPPEDRDAPLQAAEAELTALLQTARAGAMLRGARVAIVGRPNAGKSSLLNALLGYGRSIVTPEEGTTRDYLEAPLELGGFPVTLIDTAGLRDTADPIEAAGVGLARDLARGADLVLRLEDGSRPREPLPGAPGEDDPRVLLLRTKADLPSAWEGASALAVSAHSGEGLIELQRAVRERLSAGAPAGEVWLTTERQTDAARRALEHVRAAQKLPDDLASFELEDALHALAEITGHDVNEEVLSAVFANFCVGK